MKNWNTSLILKILFVLLAIKAIFFILNFVVFPSHTRVHSTHKCEKGEFTIDAVLVPYYNSFIKDAETHNFNTEHIFCINSISCGRLRTCQGLTDLDAGTIRFDDRLQNDTVGMRLVFYHELGHWFGLDHSNKVMMKSYNSKRDSTYTKIHWSDLVDDYFVKLKKSE